VPARHGPVMVCAAAESNALLTVKQLRQPADAHPMRRSTTAIVLTLLAVGLLLAPPELRGWALIGCMLALIAAIPIAARRRAGKNSALVPWAISFAVSAAISVPLLVSGRYESVGGHVFFGLILWVVLAAFFRLVAFLVGRVGRVRMTLVPWAVSLTVSAVVIVPQLVTEHYRRVGAHVFAGLIWWVILAALLRLVIFLADYFRQRLNESGAKT
jgi:hypothetical protein